MLRRLPFLLSLLLLMAVSFNWGFFARQNHFSLYHRLLFALGIGPDDLPRLEIESRSQRPVVLSKLGYLHATYDASAEQRGVIEYDPERAQSGYNIYNAYGRSGIYLIDMEGRIVHQWSSPVADKDLNHAELTPSGDVFLTLQDYGVLRIDLDSTILWEFETRAHHDLALTEEHVYVLTRQGRVIPEVDPDIVCTDDRIAVLDRSNGELLTEISLAELLIDEGYGYLMPHLAEKIPPSIELDILHTNHVEVFDGSRAHHSPLYSTGNVLVSMRTINTIAILSDDLDEVLWLWGPGNLARQHQPTLLENGRILVFDNGFSRSRVLEVEPPRGTIAWQYTSEEFFSYWGGSVQRLANGNTLITETDSGSAFEVTREGEIVWRFANPDVSDKDERSNIWRMTRIDPADLKF